MLKESSCTLAKTPLYYGRMIISKDAKIFFPDTKKAVKVTVYFDERNEEVELTYNGKWGLLYGLKRWFRQHHAAPGDKVIIQRLGENKLRLKFIKVGKKKVPISGSATSSMVNKLLLLHEE